MDAGGWSNNTKNDFATVVQRAYNWAEAQGLIERKPVRKVEKPAREPRELAIRPADNDEVMAAVKESNFRMLLAFAWETGARPQEVRAIEARHVDLALRRVTFPRKESKGKKRHRVVYLTDAAAAILEPLIAARPEGTLFRNSEGAPWTKDAINCAFCRLKGKIGRKLHLGAWCKGYATEALKAGVDVIGLATLLGHSNSVMVATVYAKVHQEPEYMAAIADKARGVKAGGDASA
jgi:integrase